MILVPFTYPTDAEFAVYGEAIDLGKLSIMPAQQLAKTIMQEQGITYGLVVMESSRRVERVIRYTGNGKTGYEMYDGRKFAQAHHIQKHERAYRKSIGRA